MKLIILAAVIGGAVYLIKFIEIPDIIGDDEIDIARIEVLKPFIAEYTNEWDNSPKWNLELYKKNLKEAELYRSADDISEAVYDKLRQNVNKDVLNRLVKLLEPDFRAAERQCGAPFARHRRGHRNERARVRLREFALGIGERRASRGARVKTRFELFRHAISLFGIVHVNRSL